MDLIEEVLEQGKEAIVLVPEIALTYQTVRRFAARFGRGVSVISSRLSAGERYDQFRRAREGEVRVMVGPYAECSLLVAYDNDKDKPGDIGAGWEEIAHWTGDTPGEDYDYEQEPEELWQELTTRNAEVAYIVPRRCDHFRLAIVCTGLVKIMRLNYIYKPGTEIRVR